LSEPSWPADRVERWPVAKLVPNARNARTHSDEQVTQLAASIEEWGWTIPVLVDEAGGIIAGHGRVMAAHRLDIEDVPVMVAAGWSESKKRAYMLADNKLTLNAEWDLERLAIEIAELRAHDFDISLIGFSESEIDDLLKADRGGLTDPDEAPEPPADPVSALGDVRLLGRHRLVCGDCTDPLVVENERRQAASASQRSALWCRVRARQVRRVGEGREGAKVRPYCERRPAGLRIV
jgi:ParB-like chromosome segregation protein Spo0J